MIEYKFKDLINGIENLPKELLNYNSILYRIFDAGTNKNYIGTAKYGLPGRLYDRGYGHVVYYQHLNKTKLKGMYYNIHERLDDFYLIIEYETSPDNYSIVLQKETEYIKKYDSVLFGYNVSIDGKSGWKEGTVCVNDGTYDLYVYPEDVDRFLNNGFKKGSCKHFFLRGTIWVNNGIESRMIDPNELELFKLDGYTEGSLIKPNKDKIWVNDGEKSRLINKSELISPEFEDFSLGRIEPPRKKRGKYDPSKKKRLVNNGEDEKYVLASEIDKFLKENPTYSLGRCKILINNPLSGVSKFINKSELDDYLQDGFQLGGLSHEK